MRINLQIHTVQCTLTVGKLIFKKTQHALRDWKYDAPKHLQVDPDNHETLPL